MSARGNMVDHAQERMGRGVLLVALFLLSPSVGFPLIVAKAVLLRMDCRGDRRREPRRQRAKCRCERRSVTDMLTVSLSRVASTPRADS